METFSTGQLTDSQKEALMEQVEQQMALASYQELLNKMVEKCFKKCISKPGASLEGQDQKCLAMCMDRFLESHSLVLKTYGNRLQRERQRIQ